MFRGNSSPYWRGIEVTGGSLGLTAANRYIAIYVLRLASIFYSPPSRVNRGCPNCFRAYGPSRIPTGPCSSGTMAAAMRRGKFCATRPKRMGGSSLPPTMACGGERRGISLGSSSRRSRQTPTMSCWLIRTTSGIPIKSRGRCKPCKQQTPAAGEHVPRLGLLRCHGGRCRAPAAAGIVPSPESPAVWFRTAAEDALGPQFRASGVLAP